MKHKNIVEYNIDVAKNEGESLVRILNRSLTEIRNNITHMYELYFLGNEKDKCITNVKLKLELELNEKLAENYEYLKTEAYNDDMPEIGHKRKRNNQVRIKWMNNKDVNNYNAEKKKELEKNTVNNANDLSNYDSDN